MPEKLTVDDARKLIGFINKGYKLPKIITDVIYKVAKKEVEDKDKVVIIKRDPNVGRDRIQAMKVKIIDGNSIELWPSIVGGFGCDFDGDSIYSSVVLCVIKNATQTYITCNILDIEHMEFLINKTEKYKDEVKVIKYDIDPNYEVSIRSIDVDTGKVSYKKVVSYSVHENIEMYKISDRKTRFEEFWSSSDHSLIVYDIKEDVIKKISPKLIKEEPSRYFFTKIKKKEL